ncbi:hypothetical protein [Streptomyces sp. NPDC056165]|uniref:hypothetical protein n=1 Tax=Streptomyces sp. NPDC056165 TaxID=3345733 RepID=UPI0035DA0494
MLIIALLVPVLLLVTLAALPALIIMPFFPGGTERMVTLLRAHISYARALLTGSRSTPGDKSP